MKSLIWVFPIYKIQVVQEKEGVMFLGPPKDTTYLQISH